MKRLTLILAATVAAHAAGPDRAFLDQYCVTCHNEKAKTAGLMLDKMDLGRVGIYGGSAGGQNALGALLFHGDFYKAAVTLEVFAATRARTQMLAHINTIRRTDGSV